MNDRTIYVILMWAAASLAVIAGASAVVVLILTITVGLKLLIPTILLVIVSVGCAMGATELADEVGDKEKKILSSDLEREVLTRGQQRELRRKRGEVVMQKALIEVENERDNIVHRQIEASKDPTKPPHQTRFGTEDRRRPEFPH